VNAEFNWWLLIVGLVAGAALVWLVLADSARRDADIEDEEIPMEAAWIAATLRDDGEAIDPQTADRVLRLHRAYLAGPPPDGPARPRTAGREPAAAGSSAPPEGADEPSEPTAARTRRRPRPAPPAD
jgi:hypothetical protein